MLWIRARKNENQWRRQLKKVGHPNHFFAGEQKSYNIHTRDTLIYKKNLMDLR